MSQLVRLEGKHTAQRAHCALVNFSTDHAEAGALREATAEEGAGAGMGDHNAVVRRQELYTRAAK